MMAKLKNGASYDMPAAGMPAHRDDFLRGNYGQGSGHKMEDNSSHFSGQKDEKYGQGGGKVGMCSNQEATKYSSPHDSMSYPSENYQQQHSKNAYAQRSPQYQYQQSSTALKPAQNYKVARPGEAPVRKMQLDQWDEEHRMKSPSDVPGFCVDELCSCGMHKCTPSRKPLPFEADSMYRQEFGPKPLPPQIRPGEVKLPPSLPFDADTSYRQEFGPKPLPPPQQVGEVRIPPTLPFEGQSAYRSEFGPKPLPPPQQVGAVRLPPSLPFDADSSYRSEFGPKPLPPIQRPGEVKLPPTLPFDADSSYRQEFRPKPLPTPMKMDPVRLPPSLPFEGNSSYRSEFVRKEQPTCQVAKLPPYPQPSYPSNHVFWDNKAQQWY